MMGKRGTKPQPTRLKLLRGNPGKRPLNEREPQPKGRLPACPQYLTGAARTAYARFGKQLTACGVATAMDAVALEGLCASYALYLEALAKVIEHGPVWMEKGQSKIPKFAYSPYWAVKNREWQNVWAVLREFGMTPSSRTAIEIDEGADEESHLAPFMTKAA